MSAPSRSINILVAALGGEGGGVLSNWMQYIARQKGWTVQATSIPGVAQRTGATTYYIEMLPPGTPKKPMSLYPRPGYIDLVAASEIVEAGRAMQNGFVTPERTTLVYSRHRVYAVVEKVEMADGRADIEPIETAARKLAAQTFADDFLVHAKTYGCPINAVLLGAIAASGVLPFARDDFEAAIRSSKKGVESNLLGFAKGYDLAELQSGDAGAAIAAALAEKNSALEEVVESQPQSHPHPQIQPQPDPQARAQIHDDAFSWPAPVRPLMRIGVERLIDYQDKDYATLYCARLKRICQAESRLGADAFPVSMEAARQLALWMSYEDVIRVADLKTRAGRAERLRRDALTGDDVPVRVTDFLKPGSAEIADILPTSLGAKIRKWELRRGKGVNRSLHLRTDRMGGFLNLWLLARMRPMRRRSLRYGEENRRIEEWLEMILGALAHKDGAAIAVEIAALAGLHKGYGDTHRRGRSNFDKIIAAYIRPLLDNMSEVEGAQTQIAALRKAALSNPDGSALAHQLDTALAAQNGMQALNAAE